MYHLNAFHGKFGVTCDVARLSPISILQLSIFIYLLLLGCCVFVLFLLFVCILCFETGLTRQVIIRQALPLWALYSRYEKKVQMSKLIDHLIGVKTAWPNPTERPVRKGLLTPSPVPRDSTQLDS